MRVLVIGSGGREHALCWKLSQEAEVFASPGNPGISQVAECRQGDPVAVANELRPDLVVVGPENPLIEGIADRLRAAGHVVFGPGANGAKLEGSKAFAKELMLSADVPTAEHQNFTDAQLAKEYARSRFNAGFAVVVKASGPAFGKGVVVSSSIVEAEEAIDAMLEEGELGESGRLIVVEDRLEGREFSLLSVCNGREILSLPVAQDYKRALDGDRGPNTGGMGSVSPPNWVSQDLITAAEETIVKPVVATLSAGGIEFRGVLFAGLMVSDGKPYCLEFNVRFGDPEIQSVVRRLGGGLASLLSAAASGTDLPGVEVLPHAAVTVVMASEGYPGNYPKGRPVSIPADIDPEVVVFHAGTTLSEGQLVTSGGRVLAVSATGSSIEQARRLAYESVKRIEFGGATYRTDIGG